MRDLTRKRFNSNNPQNNYIKLQEQIEKLQTQLRELDQLLLDNCARVSELEGNRGPRG